MRNGTQLGTREEAGFAAALQLVLLFPPDAGGRPDALAVAALALRCCRCCCSSRACPFELGARSLSGAASASAERLPEDAPCCCWELTIDVQGFSLLRLGFVDPGRNGLRCRKGMPREGGPPLGGPLSCRAKLAGRLTGSCGAGARKLSASSAYPGAAALPKLAPLPLPCCNEPGPASPAMPTLEKLASTPSRLCRGRSVAGPGGLGLSSACAKLSRLSAKL